MAVLLISCEVFRPELELLFRQGVTLPETHYLEAQLHNVPDRLRRSVQDEVDDFEEKTKNQAPYSWGTVSADADFAASMPGDPYWCFPAFMTVFLCCWDRNITRQTSLRAREVYIGRHQECLKAFR